MTTQLAILAAKYRVLACFWHLEIWQNLPRRTNGPASYLHPPSYFIPAPSYFNPPPSSTILPLTSTLHSLLSPSSCPLSLVCHLFSSPLISTLLPYLHPLPSFFCNLAVVKRGSQLMKNHVQIWICA